MQDRKKHLLSLTVWGGLMALTLYLFLKDNSLAELAAAYRSIDLKYVGLGLLIDVYKRQRFSKSYWLPRS